MYLWSGKDSSGREATDRVTAPNPELAKDELFARGWTDLQLQTSEIQDFVAKEIAAVTDPAYRPKLTPNQEVALLRGKAPGFWRNWWKSVRESAGAFLIVGVGFAWALYRQRMWGTVICGGLLLVLAFLFPALHFWFRVPAELFHKLHQARNWRRWDEVLACLESLERAQKSRKMGIGEPEMARYRALALAGSGKLNEAIDLLTKAADKANMPRWLFYSHIAGLYTVAERYNDGLDSYRQALEVATEKGIVCLDCGAYLVQRFNRPAEARQLLQLAEATVLPDLAKNHLVALRGMIAVREGDFEAANKYMKEALAGFERQPKPRYFAFEPSILIGHGYLACINAALGNKQAARDHFHKSEKYLRTIRLEEVLKDYESKMDSSAAVSL